MRVFTSGLVPAVAFLTPPRCVLWRAEEAGFRVAQDRNWVHDPGLSHPRKATAFVCPCRQPLPDGPVPREAMTLMSRLVTAVGVIRVGQCQFCDTFTWCEEEGDGPDPCRP